VLTGKTSAIRGSGGDLDHEGPFYIGDRFTIADVCRLL
jgi:glutathione S-transferase